MAMVAFMKLLLFLMRMLNEYAFLNFCGFKIIVDGKHPGCDQSYFGRREFSFTLKGDIYLRFQSYNNAVELENSIKDKCPLKIDIGPVYTVDVRIILFPNNSLLVIIHAAFTN